MATIPKRSKLNYWEDTNRKPKPTGYVGKEDYGISIMDGSLLSLAIINNNLKVLGVNSSPTWNDEKEMWEYPKIPEPTPLRKQYNKVVKEYQNTTTPTFRQESVKVKGTKSKVYTQALKSASVSGIKYGPSTIP